MLAFRISDKRYAALPAFHIFSQKISHQVSSAPGLLIPLYTWHLLPQSSLSMSLPPTDGSATCSSCFSCQNGCFHGHDDGSCADPRCIQCMRSDPPSCSSAPLLGFDSIPLKDSEKLSRVIIASAKGFSIGAGLKGGLSLFSILARLRRTRLCSSSRLSLMLS